jgi:integrase
MKGKDIITSPKTAKSNRTIKMPEFLCEEMQDYLRQLYRVQPDERIFPVTKYFINHEMIRGCKASGVKKIRVHDIRHSHVSLLINMGFSALAIGERVGHEAEKITYRYAHLFPTVQTEMADRLNDARVLDEKKDNRKGGKDDVEEKAG